jgi:hypothetical protein
MFMGLFRSAFSARAEPPESSKASDKSSGTGGYFIEA